MKKLFIACLVAVSAVLCGDDPVVVTWSAAEGGGSYYSIVPTKDAKLVKVTWEAFLTSFPMSWTRGDDGEWRYVKTPTGEEKEKEEKIITLPVHIPPYRRSLGGLIIVTPTISGAPTKK